MTRYAESAHVESVYIEFAHVESAYTEFAYAESAFAGSILVSKMVKSIMPRPKGRGYFYALFKI